jgi:acetyl-CoA carboxylase beta subunit|tara:strand:- start:1228 stop:1536 length:309 start_codon:yes stop_codon:yes gene_type:complete
MTNKEINKLKVGDKIYIAEKFGRFGFKGTRVVRQVLDHTNPETHGYPHLSVNRIIVKHSNKLQQLGIGVIYKSKEEYEKNTKVSKGGMTNQYRWNKRFRYDR